MKRIVVGLLLFYQKYLSQMKPPSCRFYPSCSTYAIQAVEKYGTVKGVYIAIKRLLKCHPFHLGGFDPLS